MHAPQPDRRTGPTPISPLRVRSSAAPPRPDRAYVLYWMIAARRTSWSHALQHAVCLARDLGKPLLVLEALRIDSEWASQRVHRYVVQGMADNGRRFAERGITYHPYVEPRPGEGSGLLQALAAQAAVVVTDDFPTHFLPRMVQAACDRLDVRVDVVDGNGAVPMAAPDRDFTVAHSFRRWLQKHLPDLWQPPAADPLIDGLHGAVLPEGVRTRWPALGDGRPTGTEPLPPLPGPEPIPEHGGESKARARWRTFHETLLPRYAEDRSHPDDDVQSGLSAALHFGHLGSHELLHDLLGDWDPLTAPPATGKRERWWGRSEPVEAFLDQILTWRELGYVQAHREGDAFTSYAGLPEWARRTLHDHRDDARPALYSLQTLAEGRTSDPLWNAAQRELLEHGRIHNALRMLWGKKVLAWTETPEEAFDVLVELNNRYAIDGRNPNSWSGIGWVFGRFDRAWGPERPIYGKVRYMTSESSRRKWRLTHYLRRYGKPAVSPHAGRA